ncbi:hypothetical protein SPRG_11243 [Saprolegnia parasitica CBS 223.65]|uniref:HPP transmembrane region domain-containing protein n=1 Tax=Saprolegnia parasitica (strain CBS 223.65) TaxID=695850 RepID=A0A067CAH7_SAPPC|nr:hypothetical protein SPRG_11243 [Saprolegnia parasitica CBS 223.65]KDO23812.1 hypothetical protein SPRG_11243 [Saprolegnia parasitica CBS 223.65]|eukprot:XP_012205446.1 hypothetical protein SPRG_11243 [Saprolegnia parasitica CBS 223.65]
MLWRSGKQYMAKMRGIDDLARLKEVNPALNLLVCDRKTMAARSRDATLGQAKHRIVFWSFISSFLGISLLSLLQYNVRLYLYPSEIQATSLIGSFGATAVLVFGVVDAPLAQPRNVIGGHVLSATIGVSIAKASLGNDYMWLACALAVSLSMVAMQLTDTMHPPAGATALLAVISPPAVRNLGYFYVISPILVGSCLLVAVSVLVNNLQRQYPRYWLRASYVVRDVVECYAHAGC